MTIFSGTKSVTWHSSLHFFGTLSVLLQEPLRYFLPLWYTLFPDVSAPSVLPACTCDSSLEDCLQTTGATSPEIQKPGELHPSRATVSQWLNVEGVPPKGLEHSPPWGIGWIHFCETLPKPLLNFSRSCSASFSPLFISLKNTFPIIHLSGTLASGSTSEDLGWIYRLIFFFKFILFDYRKSYLNQFWVNLVISDLIQNFCHQVSSLFSTSSGWVVVMVLMRCHEGLYPSGPSCQKLSEWQIILLPNYLFPCLFSLLWLNLYSA